MFKNLEGSKVDPNAAVRFTFYSIAGEPWIMVRPAGDMNKPYYNAVLKRSAKNRQRMLRGNLDEAAIARNRNEDKELYPIHVFSGTWGGWLNESGVEVPYSPDNAKALLGELPDDQFDELRAFCNEHSNFRASSISASEAESTAGN